MPNYSSLRSAVKLAIGGGTSAGLLAALTIVPAAHAQEPAAGPIEEIIVTGSRIRRADLTSASPISVVDRDQMRLTGLRDVGDLLQRMPAMSGSPLGTTINNGGTGEVQIDLRGLGVDRTVTLIDGHRIVDGGDFQTIPDVMIDRVEILKDGASAVYGADAVAGVVNIITRRDFDGISIDLQNTDYFNMDSGRQNSLSMIAGKTFDGGNFVFGAEYVDQEEAYQRDAPWDFFQDSYYIYPEGCEAHPALPYTGLPDGGCYPLGSGRIPEGNLDFLTQGAYMNPDGSGIVPYDGRVYNYAPVNYIQTPYTRMNVFANANFDLTDSIRFSAELRANHRTSAQEYAPMPYDSNLDPAYAGVFNGEPYFGISQDNYYLRQAANAAGLVAEPVVHAQRRMLESPRRFEQDVNQYQAVFSIEGDLGNDTIWEAHYNTGRRDRVDNDFGQFSGVPLALAMGPSADLNGDGVPECYLDINDPATEIPGCVPFNFFGGPNSVTQDMLDYVSVQLNDNRLTTQSVAGFSINGNAFDLPGGPLGWAAGGDYWAQSFKYSPDSAKQQGSVTGNTGLGTDGSLFTRSVFAEVFAPLYSNGTQSFDLKLGLRNDDYNLFGAESTWQLGLEFQVTDSVKLRATSGTVFRAPTILDLFEGLTDDFPTYHDPCVPDPGDALPANCAQVGIQPPDNQLHARVGGNPNVKPETGDTQTLGFVWTPALDSGDLSLTVDYWSASIEDGISSLGVQYILDDCYLNGNAASCALVTRRADYSVDTVLDGTLNVAKQGAKGVDTEFRYNFDTRVGQFQASLIWSHLLERTKVAYPGAPEVDLAGRYTDVTAEDGGGYSANKINYSLQWIHDNLSVGYLGEYVSSLDADTFCNCMTNPYIQKIDSYLYHDVVVNYDFGMGSTISFSVTNITNEPPPFIDIGFNATTEPANYRLFGRGYYLRFSQSFE